MKIKDKFHDVSGPPGAILEKNVSFMWLFGPLGAIFEKSISFMWLFGPPGATFEKNTNLQNQEEHFSIFENGFKSRFDSARI